MFHDSKVSDKDIDFFNQQLKEIDDIDSLIQQMENNEVKQVFNLLTYCKNIESAEESIDPVKAHLTKVYDMQDFLTADEESPLYPVANYFDGNTLLYPSYLKMIEAKKEFENAPNHQLLFKRYIGLLDSILSYSKDINPFTVKLSDNLDEFDPGIFYNAMKFLQNNIEQISRDDQQKVEDIQEMIINTPFVNLNYFLPLSNFYLYVLDQLNYPILERYFENFTPSYFETLSKENIAKSKLLSRCVQKIDGSIRKKIASFLTESDSDKVIAVINKFMIPKIIDLTKRDINRNVESLEELEKIEASQIIDNLTFANFEKTIIERKNLHNHEYPLLQKYSRYFIKNLNSKFDSIYSEFEKKKKYQEMVKILTLFNIFINDNLKNGFVFNRFSEYEQKMINQSIKKGKELANDQLSQLRSFRNPFLSISDHIANTIDYLRHGYENFRKEFLGMETEAHKLNYSTIFCYGFIQGVFCIFYDKLKAKANIQEVIPSWVSCLYTAMNMGDSNILHPNEEVLGDNFTKDFLFRNFQNLNIPKQKRICYEYLLKIMEIADKK